MDNTAQSSAPVSESSIESTSIESSSPESLEASVPSGKAAGGKQAVKQAAEQAKRLNALRLKIDGHELEEELPFEIPDDPKAVEYMTRQLQMAKMGSKRAQEYAQLEKEIRNLIQEGTKKSSPSS